MSVDAAFIEIKGTLYILHNVLVSFYCKAYTFVPIIVTGETIRSKVLRISGLYSLYILNTLESHSQVKVDSYWPPRIPPGQIPLQNFHGLGGNL